MLRLVKYFLIGGGMLLLVILAACLCAKIIVAFQTISIMISLIGLSLIIEKIIYKT